MSDYQTKRPLSESDKAGRIGTTYQDPTTGEFVMPPDFPGDEEIRWKPDGVFHVWETPLEQETAKCPVCCQSLEDSGQEEVFCDYCENPIGYRESFAVVRGATSPFVYHLGCYDAVYHEDGGMA